MKREKFFYLFPPSDLHGISRTAGYPAGATAYAASLGELQSTVGVLTIPFLREHGIFVPARYRG
jgi:hypothetical protein